MPMLTQFRDPRLSLWQSAVDEAIHSSLQKTNPGNLIPRPSLEDGTPEGAIMNESSRYCSAIFNNVPIAHLLRGTAALGPSLTQKTLSLKDQLSYCSAAHLRIAEAQLRGDQQAADQLKEDLKMGNCDPRFATALSNYVKYFTLRRAAIPYRPEKDPPDNIITIPDDCKIALVGDWGTGQQPALATLQRIADKKPDFIVHLGDIYYSGTQYEADNYFLKIFQSICKKQDFAADATPRIFTMAGNHDMYSGGQGYYWLLDQIHQPASFFLLRNTNWRIFGLDTGINDHDPFTVNQATPTLTDDQLDWLTKNMQNGNGRTILLSHHPLFSAYERINDKSTNNPLLEQLRSLLPQITAWFWAHEHNLVIYKEFLNIHGRCIGHGAFPVGVGEIGRPYGDVPFFTDYALSVVNGMYKHGYVMIDLKGAFGTATYYECDPNGAENQLYQESINSLP
jgi:hypothetical protein